MPGERDIRVLTWNLFHGQDGSGLGPTAASVLARRSAHANGRIHLNRKWIAEMADVIAARHPTIAALQEVPPLAVDELARRTGMDAAHALMPPLVGTTRLRGRLAAWNPDLWRTHEGTANVLLIAPGWRIVPGGLWTVRHNPPGFALRRAVELRLRPSEAWHWLWEPRRLVAARLRNAAGQTLTAASLHCHNHSDPHAIAAEIRRIVPKILERLPDHEPVIFAGDLNAAGLDHPAIRALTAAGFAEDSTADLGLDHVFHRGLTVTSVPTRLERRVRETSVRWKAQPWVVVLSDHDIVEAGYRLPDPPAQ